MKVEGPYPPGVPGGTVGCGRARGKGLAMGVADVVVLVGTVVAVAGLAWFFFGPRTAHAAQVSDGVQRVTVRVAGGYSPDVIRVRQGVPLEVVFDRQETGDCTSRVVFPDLQVSAALPA